MSADARAGPRKAKRLIQAFEKKEVDAGARVGFGDQKETARVDAQRLKQSFERPAGAAPLRPAAVVREPAAAPKPPVRNVREPAAQAPLRPAAMATPKPAMAGNEIPQPGAVKTALIVYAHPEAKSFNHAMLDVAEKTLRNQGYIVNVSDLYAMNFNAVVSKNDIVGE